ncbi:MAG: GNAT family protein [Lachnospiraceae bacterium]|nr:GNAT family protein [Lachnospiraceae bacterium]
MNGNKCAGGVYLRPIQRSDTEDIVKWRNNPQVRKNFIYQEPFTVEGHNHWFDTMIIPQMAVQFIIVEEITDRPIGSVYLRDIDRKNRKAEYGVFIGEDSARGHGYGTAACRLICDYAFHELSLHKIYLRVFSDNLAAQKSYKKAGFKEEAYAHDTVRINGKYRDMIFMALINPSR